MIAITAWLLLGILRITEWFPPTLNRSIKLYLLNSWICFSLIFFFFFVSFSVKAHISWQPTYLHGPIHTCGSITQPTTHTHTHTHTHTDTHTEAKVKFAHAHMLIIHRAPWQSPALFSTWSPDPGFFSSCSCQLDLTVEVGHSDLPSGSGWTLVGWQPPASHCTSRSAAFGLRPFSLPGSSLPTIKHSGVL